MFWFRHWICRHIKIPTETYCKCSTKSLGGRVGGGGDLIEMGLIANGFAWWNVLGTNQYMASHVIYDFTTISTVCGHSSNQISIL